MGVMNERDERENQEQQEARSEVRRALQRSLDSRG